MAAPMTDQPKEPSALTKALRVYQDHQWSACKRGTGRHKDQYEPGPCEGCALEVIAQLTERLAAAEAEIDRLTPLYGEVTAEDLLERVKAAEARADAATKAERERCAKLVCSCCAKGEARWGSGPNKGKHQDFVGGAHYCKAILLGILPPDPEQGR